MVGEVGEGFNSFRFFKDLEVKQKFSMQGHLMQRFLMQVGMQSAWFTKSLFQKGNPQKRSSQSSNRGSHREGSATREALPFETATKVLTTIARTTDVQQVVINP